jgi:hypothetical protein
VGEDRVKSGGRRLSGGVLDGRHAAEGRIVDAPTHD